MIPQEAGLNDRAVSFTKGCYVGQETVARLYYRGKPNRHLRGLRLVGAGARRAIRDRVRADGVVGRLGERRRSRRGSGRSGWRSSAARRRPAQTSRSASGRAPAEVVELPFAAARGATSPPANSRERRAVGLRLERQLRRVRVRGEVRLATIRTSSISSGGTCAPSSPARPAARAARSQCARAAPPPSAISGPQSTSRPPDQPEGLEAPGSRRMGARAPAGAARAWPRARRRAAPGSPPGAAPAGAGPGRARTALAAEASPHLGVDVRRAGAGRRPRRRRRTAGAPRPAAGDTGSGRGRRGTATGSGPSARRPTDARGAAAAGRSGAGRTAESSCSTSSSASRRPSHRPDRHRVAGGRVRARPRGSETRCPAGSGCTRAGRRRRVSRMLPAGRSSLISRFSSTSAPSSERVVR